MLRSLAREPKVLCNHAGGNKDVPRGQVPMDVAFGRQVLHPARCVHPKFELFFDGGWGTFFDTLLEKREHAAVLAVTDDQH